MTWHATTTVVPLEWQRYRDRLRANGWDSSWSLARVVDNIADEMFDQYAHEHGYHTDDSEQAWDDIWALAEEAACDLDGEW